MNFVFKFLIGSAVLVPAVLSSCGTQKVKINLDKMAKDTSLNVGSGNKIVVSVYENLSTGFMWDFEGSNTSVQLLKEGYKKERIPKGIVGSGLTKIYVFKALNPGKCELSFTYSRGVQFSKAAHKSINLIVE